MQLGYYFYANQTPILGSLMASRVQLDAFTRGVIVGMAKAGAGPSEIAAAVQKSDGSHPSIRAVQNTVSKAAKDSTWRGQRKTGSGRTPVLSSSLLQRMTRLVFKHRGKAMVTIAFCRKAIPALRRYHHSTLCRALHAAGLAWLRRRRKRVVPQDSRLQRCAFARYASLKSIPCPPS